MRPLVRALLALLASACFVDATGEAPGEGGSTAGSTTATTGSFASSTGVSSSSTASVSTSVASSSSSGVGGCDNGVLRFDGGDMAAAPYDVTFDFADDFVIGVWARASPDPKFTPGDATDRASVLIRRMSTAQDRGYSLGLAELFDDGMLHPTISIRNGFDDLCSARALDPIPLGAWVHIAASYLRSAAGDDLTLYVNGESVDANDCGDLDVGTHAGDLELGGSAEHLGTLDFMGDLDDVFLARSSGAVVQPAHPVPCSLDYVAAFPFDVGGTSVCAAPLLIVTPGTAVYAADCEL